MIPITPKTIKLIGIAISFICGSIFISLIAASSTGPVVQNLYVIQIRDTRNSTDGFVLRVGYFGICEGVSGKLQCSNSRAITSHHGDQSATHRPWHDFGVAMQRDIFFPWIMAIAAAFYFVGSFCLLPKEISVGPRPLLRKVVNISLGLSIASTFIAAVAATQAKNALVITTTVLPTSFSVTSGGALFILHWLFGGFAVLLWILSVEVNPFNLFKKLPA
jgi:hypothetical protein